MRLPIEEEDHRLVNMACLSLATGRLGAAPKSLLLATILSVPAVHAGNLPGEDVSSSADVNSVIVSGTSIADYWAATPAQYAAAAEAILDSAGVSNLQRGSIAASATAELLIMFAGGGGAPQDVVEAKRLTPTPSAE